MKQRSNERRPAQRSWISRWIGRLTFAGVIALAPAAAAVLAGVDSWPWELAHHFVRHFAALALIAALLLAGLRRPRAAVFGFIVAGAFTVPIWQPTVAPNDASANQSARTDTIDAVDPRSIDMLTLNVLRNNTAIEAVWERIKASDADIVALQEVPPALADRIDQDDAASHPYRKMVHVGGDYDGVAILSRYPILDSEVIKPFENAWSALLAVVEVWPDRPITVISLHAWPPSSRRELEWRDAYLASIARRVASIAGPVIVAGDFNATPYTPAYRRFLSAANVTGIEFEPATWPSGMGIFGIPIDHILTRGLLIDQLAAQKAPGSDHRLVIAKLHFTPNSVSFYP